jgi:hypothetical protein
MYNSCSSAAALYDLDPSWLLPCAWPTSRGESARSLEHYALSSSVSRGSFSLLSLSLPPLKAAPFSYFPLELMDKPFLLSLIRSLCTNCQKSRIPNFIIEL